jgi:DNA repair exonuclease SbcCD ATPase subunit
MKQELDPLADLKIKLEKCENDQRNSAELNVAYKEKINEYEARISDLQNELQKKTAEFVEAIENRQENSQKECECEKTRIAELNLANAKIAELKSDLEKMKTENKAVLEKHTNSLKEEDVGSEAKYERVDDEKFKKIEKELNVANEKMSGLQSDLKIIQEENEKLVAQLNQSIEENKTLTVTIDEFKVKKVTNYRFFF